MLSLFCWGDVLCFYGLTTPSGVASIYPERIIKQGLNNVYSLQTSLNLLNFTTFNG